jgi:FtsZ-interacting cell division protein ZipA
MTDLQLSLIGAGAVGVAAVWAYNVWQERKVRRATEALLKRITPVGDDVLLGDDAAPHAAQSSGEMTMSERIEPTLAAAEIASGAEEETSATEDRPDIVAVTAPAIPVTQAAVNPVTGPPVAGAIQDPSALPGQWADELADCVLRFTTIEPVPAPAVWTLQAAWSGDLTKPVHWLAYDPAEKVWRRLDGNESGRFAQWAAALQLADRCGAVSASELARFFDGVKHVADMVAATLELPAREQVALKAAAMDEFCAGVDIQFRFHVTEAGGGVFNGTKLRGVAEALGLALEADGMFHARDADQSELFVVSNLGEEGFSVEALRTLVTHGITLCIDVPRTRDGGVAFARMMATGEQLARGLGGVLVDAQRAPLSAAMIAAMRAKIIEVQQRMRDAGIDPGSTRALRLFS